MKTTRHGANSTQKYSDKNSETKKIKYELSDLDSPVQDIQKFGSLIVKPGYLSDVEFYLFASRYVTVGFSEEHRRDLMEVIMNLPDAPQFIIPIEEERPREPISGVIPIGVGEQELVEEA